MSAQRDSAFVQVHAHDISSGALKRWLPVVGLTFLAAIVCLLFVGRKSFDLDEAVSTAYAQMGWTAFVRRMPDDPNMLLYYLLLRVWVAVGFGTGDFAIRTLSVVFAVATVPLVYLLGTRMFGPRAGAIGALFLTLNSFWVSYAQYARSYSLVVFLVTLSMLLYLRSLARPSTKNWVGYTVVSTFAVYSHFFATPVLAAQWIALIFRPRRDVPWKGVLISALIICGAALPLAYAVVFRDRNLVSWIPRITPHQFYFSLLYLTGARSAGWGGRILRWLYGISCLAALIIAIRLRAYPTSRISSDLWHFGLLLSWLTVPPILAYVVSVIVTPIYQEYYLLIVSPALVLLAAGILSRLRSPWVLSGIVTLVVLAMCQSIAIYYEAPAPEEYRGATQYIVANTRQGDAIILYSSRGITPYAHYVRNGAGPVVIYPTTSFSTGDDSAVLMDVGFWKAVSRYSRVWLLVSHDNSGITDVIQGNLSHRDRLIETRRFSKGVLVQLYNHRL